MTLFLVPGKLYRLTQKLKIFGWQIYDQNHLYCTFRDKNKDIANGSTIMCLGEKYIDKHFQHCPIFLYGSKIIWFTNDEQQSELFRDHWDMI